jgi:alpha-1,3-rhamnosyl/mannosyltransferase
VAGDGASIVACGDPEGLASAIDDLWFDETRREQARVRGLAQARGFTWRRCAEETVRFFAKSLE